jgi:hypothetical protein
MNDALKKWLAEGNEITQIPYGVPRDMQVCMNCKGIFPMAELTKGATQRCKNCLARHTNAKRRGQTC